MDPKDLENKNIGTTEQQDREWAKALNMEYTPPQPPPIPADALPKSDESDESDLSDSSDPSDSSERSPRPLPPLPPRQQFRPAPPTEPMPKTYLVWAIVATLCCCLPLGAVAIIFASKVTSLYYQGNIEGARRASERAQLWIIITIVAGVLSNILYFPLMMLFGDFSTGMQF